MPPPQTTHNSPSKPSTGGKSAVRRQDGLVAAAQAAYTLLADDSESGSGSDSSLGGAQGSVGAAEQQITVEADGSDKSAPVKQRAKAAGAEARAAAAGGVAASGAAAAGDGAGGGAVAVRGAAAGGAGMRRRPRLWSLKKAGATVAAVVREDVRRVFSTYLLVSVFEAAALLASTVFVTLPLTIPRLLNVQLAVPLAAVEGARGRDAMRASKARMLGYRRSAAAMLGLVFVLQKALPPASAVLIAALPPAVIVQVPEAVVLVLLAGQALLFGASQLKGLAALLIYNHTAQHAHHAAPDAPQGGAPAAA